MGKRALHLASLSRVALAFLRLFYNLYIFLPLHLVASAAFGFLPNVLC